MIMLRQPVRKPSVHFNLLFVYIFLELNKTRSNRLLAFVDFFSLLVKRFHSMKEFNEFSLYDSLWFVLRFTLWPSLYDSHYAHLSICLSSSMSLSDSLSRFLSVISDNAGY